ATEDYGRECPGVRPGLRRGGSSVHAIRRLVFCNSADPGRPVADRSRRGARGSVSSSPGRADFAKIAQGLSRLVSVRKPVFCFAGLPVLGRSDTATALKGFSLAPTWKCAIRLSHKSISLADNRQPPTKRR